MLLSNAKAISNRLDTKFNWFIPIDGDGEHIGTVSAERPPTFDYLKNVAVTAEKEGFHSLLVPTRFSNGLFEETEPLSETWTTVTALATSTKRIRFLIAVRPGFISPPLFAHMAATLDHISNSRIDLNIVPGGIPGDLERLGENLDHDQRYDRASEFIEVCRKLWENQEPVVFRGKTISIDGAICSPTPNKTPGFYIGGASEKAMDLCANQGDAYLSWIMPRNILVKHLSQMQAKSKARNRIVKYGLRTHIIVRENEAKAWEAAEELLSVASPKVMAQRKSQSGITEMVGRSMQERNQNMHRDTKYLWNGISSVRVNCGTALVGDLEQVSEELLEYWKLGIDEFILSGYPHLEECRRVSRELLPLVKRKIETEKQKLN